MKDFTKKGTKLPIIPVGTEYSIPNIFPEICKFKKKNQNYESRKDFISYGAFNETWIKAEVKNYSSDDYYLFKLSTIERLAKEQGMCSEKIQSDDYINATMKALEYWGKFLKSNTNNEQMNPTIKLQENGTVTVTDTETTTTLSKTTVDEICRLVKEDGEKVKKPELGKWYEFYIADKLCNVICVTKIDGNRVYFYGIDLTTNIWEESNWFHINNDYKPASPETVQQYLKAEFIRSGSKVGAKVECLTLGNPKNVITELKFEMRQNTLWVKTKCWHGWSKVFDNGKFATIIQPETITRAEAEKRYDVKITD